MTHICCTVFAEPRVQKTCVSHQCNTQWKFHISSTATFRRAFSVTLEDRRHSSLSPAMAFERLWSDSGGRESEWPPLLRFYERQTIIPKESQECRSTGEDFPAPTCSPWGQECTSAWTLRDLALGNVFFPIRWMNWEAPGTSMMSFTYSRTTSIRKRPRNRITLYNLSVGKVGRHQLGRSGTKWWNESCIDLQRGDLRLMLLQPTDFPAALALEEP